MLPLFSVNSVMASTSDSVPSFTAVGYTRTDATSPPNNHHLSSLSHVTLITVTVLAVAVTVSLALYFLLRYRNSNRFRFLRRVSPSTSAAAFSSSGNRILPETTSSSSVFDLLPTFTFSSIRWRRRLRRLFVEVRAERPSPLATSLLPRISRGMHRHVASVEAHVSALPIHCRRV